MFRRTKDKPSTVYTLSGKRIDNPKRWMRSRWSRHVAVDLIALRKRRAKNKVARASRRINRVRAK